MTENIKRNGWGGLSEERAAEMLKQNGRNELRGERGKTVVENFMAQINDPLIYVLLGAAGVSFLLRERADAVIIGVVILLNAVVGMLQEGKARKALEALKKLTSPHAIVVRDGIKKEIPAAELVVGDMVCLEAGCQVPADMVLTEACNLRIEEAALTGENLPVEKVTGKYTFSDMQEGKIGITDKNLGDCPDRAFMSTIVTGGHGTGIVTAVGMETQIGKIAELISGSEDELTPLQRRLGDLGKLLSILALILCGLLFVLAMYQKRNIMEMLLVAISLAVAAVPEGLPAVVTICLALSVTRMVKANAIIRRLPSVETLGAVSVVCSDKTGTLTQNRMTVEVCTGKSEDLFYAMILCNDSELQERLGDPTELALLEYGQRMGYNGRLLRDRMPRISERPFDSERKMMTTLHKRENGSMVSYTKGAPDVVLPKCTRIMTEKGVERMRPIHVENVQKTVDSMAADALRTLAVAMYVGKEEPVEEELVFLGIVGMRDPVRPEAVEAVATFKKAGVKTVMITGDHVETAYAIARQLGIAQKQEQCMSGGHLAELSEEALTEALMEKNITVFARVSPIQKVEIVKGFKNCGAIVAMTGDGVNDAPSLKCADIGIAMGKNGTDVAKQASDMILADDNFATIEKAIEEGRGVYENIRKSVIFLLSSNMGEILTMFTAILFGVASPLKSCHILWINLITDSLPALALGVDKNDGTALMANTPRKEQESLFARGGFLCTLFYGVLIAGISLTAFLLLPGAALHAVGKALSVEGVREMLVSEGILTRAQTYAFTVLGVSQLFHALGMRDTGRLVFTMKPAENRLMLVAVAMGLILQLAVTRIPFLVEAFGTAWLSWGEWLMLTGLAAVPLLAHECIVIVGKLFGNFT